jgi:uncharacterized heparinase superfamily protein
MGSVVMSIRDMLALPDWTGQAWRRILVSAARGSTYLTIYARWRAIRLCARLRQRLYAPAWPPVPDLSAAGIAAGALPVEAGPALARYLAARERPHFHFSVAEAAAVARQIPSEQRAQTLSVADVLLKGQHTYRGIRVAFDTEPDWEHTPGGSLDWRWDFNRHYWLTTLARAWRYSGDEAFARQAAHLLRHWMAHNPPDVRNPVWRPFEVATRLNNWVWGLFLLLDSTLFIQEGMGYLWQGLVAQARYLYRNLEHHVMNNHLLVEAKTLAMLGLLFPEVREASRWSRRGLEILWTQVHRQFHPDGVHTEQATQYHCLCTSELWELLNLLRCNASSIPSDVLARFEAAVAFQDAVIKPDGHIPLFGDSARHDQHCRFDARWAFVWLEKGAPPVESPDEETRWLLGTRSLSGEPGALPTSQAFPHGGYAVMRGGPTYLVLDCGPFGNRVVPSHAHADALSVELCAWGQTLLTDSGGYSYHAAPVWRSFFRSTRAHNTVGLDGQDQSELVGTRLVHHPAHARLVEWLSAPMADWAVAEHDGYTRFTSPVMHRRRVLFVKPHYWLLLDSLLGHGDHQLDWYFHLPPGTFWVLEPDGGALCATMGEAGLTIVPNHGADLRSRVVEGQISPPQGWVSLESGEKSTAPTLIFTREGALPVHLPTALVPHPASQSVSASVRTLMLDDRRIIVVCETPNCCDYIGIALDDSAASLQLPSLEAEAQALLVRHRRGQPPLALAIGVDQIRVSGSQVWTGPTRRWVSLAEEGGEWYVAGRE